MPRQAHIYLPNEERQAILVPHYEDEIELRTTLNPCGLEVEIGRKLSRLLDACEKWIDREAQPLTRVSSRYRGSRPRSP